MWRKIVFAFVSILAIGGGLETSVAQNTGPPDAVVEVINDVKLGVEAYGGVTHRDQTIHPLETRNLKYLQRPVRETLSYSVPYVGVGVTLRFRGAELAFTIQESPTRQRDWLQFEDGSHVLPYSASTAELSLRAGYFVFDWGGVGVAYRGGPPPSITLAAPTRLAAKK